jgi:hypothetical protein
MLKQRTLGKGVRATGVGVHTGRKVAIELRPAPPNTGIVFGRTDLPGAPSVAARATNVVDTRMATVIESGSARVSTIEHLMSAFAGLGVADERFPVMEGHPAPHDREVLGEVFECGHSRHSGIDIRVLQHPLERRLGRVHAIFAQFGRGVEGTAGIDSEHHFHGDDRETGFPGAFDRLAHTRRGSIIISDQHRFPDFGFECGIDNFRLVLMS